MTTETLPSRTKQWSSTLAKKSTYSTRLCRGLQMQVGCRTPKMYLTSYSTKSTPRWTHHWRVSRNLWWWDWGFLTASLTTNLAASSSLKWTHPARIWISSRTRWGISGLSLISCQSIWYTYQLCPSSKSQTMKAAFHTLTGHRLKRRTLTSKRAFRDVLKMLRMTAQPRTCITTRSTSATSRATQWRWKRKSQTRTTAQKKLRIKTTDATKKAKQRL